MPRNIATYEARRLLEMVGTEIEITKPNDHILQYSYLKCTYDIEPLQISILYFTVF